VTKDEFQALLNARGGMVSDAVVVDPYIDNPKKGQLDEPDKIKNPNPTYEYVLKDGTHLRAKSSLLDPGDPNSEVDTNNIQIVDPGSATAPPKPSDDQTGVKEQRAAEAQAAQALADQRKADQAQRDKNAAATGFALTDAELARLRSDEKAQGLTGQGLALRAQEIAQSGQIAAANNAIAAAQQALASKRLELDQAIKDHQISQDDAKFEYLKAKDAADQEIAQGRLDLERLQTAQTNQIAAGTLQQRKDEAAQRASEFQQTAQQNAQQNAMTAASTILSSERQARSQGATAGASLLNQRVSSAQGMLNSILGLAGQGQRSGNMGGGLMSVPAGLGEQIIGGITGWTRDLGGGQSVYDAAARLVQHADPSNGASPEAQVAMGVLGQMLERYKGLTGEDHPLAQSVEAQTGTSGDSTASTNLMPVDIQTQAQSTQYDPRFMSPAVDQTVPLLTPGVAGTVAPGSPQFLGTFASPALNNLAPFQRGQVYG